MAPWNKEKLPIKNGKYGANADFALYFNGKKQRLMDRGQVEFRFEFYNGEVLKLKLYEVFKSVTSIFCIR